MRFHRAGDLVDPLWGLLDMTPEGRGDFFPKVNYDWQAAESGDKVKMVVSVVAGIGMGAAAAQVLHAQAKAVGDKYAKFRT
ncbi:MAG: hypothetical protein U1E60_21760 [Reyranellaceae bacterium]